MRHPAKLRPAPDEAMLSPGEIGALIEALTFAQRELVSAVKDLRDDYRLGPRGPWIVGQINRGQFRTQADVVRYYKVGRSIITDEMRMLHQAGLVATRTYENDARQLGLTLTTLGEKFADRIGQALGMVIRERVSHYSRPEILACTRLLRDLASGVPAGVWTERQDEEYE
ncbi:hypothetical protein ACFSCW_15465 [Sphingomonas tabacisoli]|uniref:MarR family transcriptional regulator n=1 Tax=Sphingomonas tabacisoli TaxID=2249466 RepID=A0ABW4I714_9SPHN